MDGLFNYVLDVLGEFGGGRGASENDYVRFGLGALLFGVLLVWAIRKSRDRPSERESLLVLGFAVGLAREVFKFVVKSLQLQGIYEPATLELFFPPIDHALLTAARVIIAAAFIKYLLRSSLIAQRYIVMGLLAVAAFYLLIAPIWWQAVVNDPAIRFSKHIGDWLIHGTGFALSLVAIILFLRAKGWARTAVVIAFTMIALDDLLMLINLWYQDSLKSTLTPIRHNLHLWAIAVLGYIYARERNEEHRRVTQQLQQDERIRSVGQLAAGVAHDFNNQLQAILGFAELARAQPGADSEALRQIQVSGNRAAKLVNKLLVFSRTNAETSATCMPDDVLRSIGPMLNQLLGARYKMQIDLDAPLTHIGISTTEMEQIVTNLVVNARDAMEDGGEIRIRTDVLRDAAGAPKFLRLTVADNGSGMDDTTLNHAFDPFFSTKEFGTGAGLGLATVYGIVNRVGGKVRTDSTLGIGTTQKLTFDIVAPTKTQTTHGQPVERPVGKLRILVADDEPAVRDYATTVLKAAGHVVIPVTDGREAVQRTLEMRDQIDLLMLDINMPELSGYEAWREIQTTLPDMPVLFASGNNAPKGDADNIHPHIQKPFNREKLLDAIARAMTR